MSDLDLLTNPPATFKILAHIVGHYGAAKVALNWTDGTSRVIRTSGDQQYTSLRHALSAANVKEIQ